MEYTVGLYSFNLASEKQRQHFIPYAFLFSQKEDHTDWWFAVKYTIGNTNICSHSYNVNGNNSYGGVVDQANKLEFFLNLALDKTGNPFDTEDKDKIIQTLSKKFEKKTKDSHESSSAQPQGIEAVLTRLFDGCSEFLALDELAGENIEKLAAGKKNEERIGALEKENDRLEEDLKNKEAKLGDAETEKRDLQEQLDKAKAEIEKVKGELEKAISDSNDKTPLDWKNWLQTEALNGLLIIVIVVFGFLFFQNLAKRFDDKIESYNNKKNKSHLNDMQQILNSAIRNFKVQQNVIPKSIINPVDQDKSGKQLKPPIETDTKQAKTLSKKLDDMDQQLKRFISQYKSGEPFKTDFNNLTHQFQDQLKDLIARGKEYNDKLEKLRRDMLKKINDTKAGQEQAMKNLLPDIQMTQNEASKKLAAHMDQQFNIYINQDKQLEQLRLDYENVKGSRLDMQTQLEDAKASQEQERERFLRLKDQSVRIYQQGGLKLSDEESENLTSERLEELNSCYSNNPMVRQYGQAINELKNSLSDPALTDESFFKAVELNVLKERLNRIESFLGFYESGDLSEFLLGHWHDNIQLIFRACLLLKSYFQLDKNPVLLDLQLARAAAEKLLWEHGLIPDDFQLPVPSHELERKFEVTVHGDIPADLKAHAGFEDEVRARLRSGAHKVVCYVKRWGLSARADFPYTHDLPGTVLKSLERLDPVVRGWED